MAGCRGCVRIGGASRGVLVSSIARIESGAAGFVAVRAWARSLPVVCGGDLDEGG